MQEVIEHEGTGLKTRVSDRALSGLLAKVGGNAKKLNETLDSIENRTNNPLNLNNKTVKKEPKTDTVTVFENPQLNAGGVPQRSKQVLTEDEEFELRENEYAVAIEKKRQEKLDAEREYERLLVEQKNNKRQNAKRIDEFVHKKLLKEKEYEPSIGDIDENTKMIIKEVVKSTIEEMFKTFDNEESQIALVIKNSIYHCSVNKLTKKKAK